MWHQFCDGITSNTGDYLTAGYHETRRGIFVQNPLLRLSFLTRELLERSHKESHERCIQSTPYCMRKIALININLETESSLYAAATKRKEKIMIRTPSQNRLLDDSMNLLMAKGPPPLRSARGLQQRQPKRGLECCFYSLDEPDMISPNSTLLLAHSDSLPRPRHGLLLKPVPKKIQGSMQNALATSTKVCNKNEADCSNLFVPIGLSSPATNNTGSTLALLSRFPSSLNERHPYKLKQRVSSRSSTLNTTSAGYSRINKEARLPLTIPTGILVPELWARSPTIFWGSSPRLPSCQAERQELIHTIHNACFYSYLVKLANYLLASHCNSYYSE